MSTTAPRPRPSAGSRRRLLGGRPWPRLTLRRLLGVAAALAVLAGAWLGVSSSSLVRVTQVQVSGLSGAQAGVIGARLEAAARQMTTLRFHVARLTRAVADEPVVAQITAITHFPHRVAIHVTETIPVAVLTGASRSIAVDAQGQLLPDFGTAGLPRLTWAPPSGGDQVTSSSAREVLTILGAAPYEMLPHIASATLSSADGVVVQLRNGPALRFGDASEAIRKWQAADATLANANSAGAAYIDVSAPTRAAAG